MPILAHLVQLAIVLHTVHQPSMQMAPGRFESPWPGPSNVGYAESSTSLESPTFDESHSSTLAAGYPSLMTDPRERWSKHSHTSSTRSFSPIDSWSGRSTSRQAHPQSRTTSRSSSGFDSHSRTGDWSGGGSDWETQCKRLKEENLVLNGEVTTWKYVLVYSDKNYAYMITT